MESMLVNEVLPGGGVSRPDGPHPYTFETSLRFPLAWEGETVFSRWRISRHATHFRADEPGKRASDLPFGSLEAFPPVLSPQPLFSRSPNRSLAPHAHQP